MNTPQAAPAGTKTFASQADLEEKQVTFSKLSDNAYAYTAEGDPNTGIIVGDDAVLVLDTQATPVMAQDVIRRIREVTDKPIKYVLLTHYHAVRVLGASAYGAEHIIASQDTRDLIVERGEQDKASESGRFPRLFRTVESVPAGLQGTRNFIADVRDSVEAGVKAGKDLNAVYKETMARLSPTYGHWVIFQHCMPFDVTRCYDEMTGHRDPRIWTAERDVEMWRTLES
ncbi:MAG: MBL fold metallo-hydrolase [Rubrivivax sp.]|nr:MBL fold metallo-hydrolase [Rubrivivax sp.]